LLDPLGNRKIIWDIGQMLIIVWFLFIYPLQYAFK